MARANPERGELPRRRSTSARATTSFTVAQYLGDTFQAIECLPVALPGIGAEMAQRAENVRVEPEQGRAHERAHQGVALCGDEVGIAGRVIDGMRALRREKCGARRVA